MRYLVFGDVHGNLPALEEMLSAEKHNFDQMISHGDVVNYGPWSNECVALLEREGCICLTGNHEKYFLAGAYPGENETVKAFFAFCYPLFYKKESIANYAAHYDVGEYRIVHTLHKDYIYPDTDLSGYNLDRNYIIGHSHYQFQKRANGYTLWNTGSVGQNRAQINAIDYVLFDEEQKRVEMKSILYDVDKVINKMAALNYPQICLNYYRNKKRK